MTVTAEDGQEQFVAVDEGVLVKCGPEVLVSVRDAVTGPPLGELRQAVDEQFRRLDEQEQQARAALGRLEATSCPGGHEMGGPRPWLKLPKASRFPRVATFGRKLEPRSSGRSRQAGNRTERSGSGWERSA